jgi:choline kinase
MLPTAAMDIMSSLVLENRPPPSPSQPKHDLSASVAAARIPPASTHSNVSDEENDYVRRRVEYLMWETRIWRGINSVQWVLWGIVQAKIPGMPDIDVDKTPQADEVMEMKLAVKNKTTVSEPDETDDEEEEEEEDGFDYLSYARERAAFFWGDVISQNIMTKDELPPETVQEARALDY